MGLLERITNACETTDNPLDALFLLPCGDMVKGKQDYDGHFKAVREYLKGKYGAKALNYDECQELANEQNASGLIVFHSNQRKVFTSGGMVTNNEKVIDIGSKEPTDDQYRNLERIAEEWRANGFRVICVSYSNSHLAFFYPPREPIPDRYSHSAISESLNALPSGIIAHIRKYYEQ